MLLKQRTAPAVHTKKHEYCIGRAIQARAEQKELRGLEGEMQARACSRERTRGSGNEIIVPLVGPNSFCRSDEFITAHNTNRRAEAGCARTHHFGWL